MFYFVFLVLTDQVDLRLHIASIHRLHSADEERGIGEITH